MSQPLGYRIPQLPRPPKRKRPPLPLLPLPARETPLTSGQLTLEIPDGQGTDPPTKKMPAHVTQATQHAPLPTWGQVKALCHQAWRIASSQGSPASPEKMFIAMLALLSCQVSEADV
uniref:Uncharacterized protein n=1 Tax=Capra hircus TaxID=9925 RepID=A0A452FVR3_CAPHI